MMTHADVEVKILGKGTVKSPLKPLSVADDRAYGFTNKDDRILFDPSLENFLNCKNTGEIPISFEKAGPSEFLYFEPAKTKVAIVTCGGLCHGLNNVIRSLVKQLHYRYSVNNIIGI